MPHYVIVIVIILNLSEQQWLPSLESIIHNDGLVEVLFLAFIVRQDHIVIVTFIIIEVIRDGGKLSSGRLEFAGDWAPR